MADKTSTTIRPADYPPTPNLDKMIAVKDQSQPIGEFVEWLGSQGWQVAKYGKVTSEEPCTGENLLGALCENGVLNPGTHKERTCTRCKGTGWYTRTGEGWSTYDKGTEALLAEYFEIDDKAASKERDAVYRWMQAQSGD